MDEDVLNEDPAPELGPETWVNGNIEAAIENLVEILYSEGAGVNGVVITLPSAPGDDFTLHLDYGDVTVKATEEF